MLTGQPTGFNFFLETVYIGGTAFDGGEDVWYDNIWIGNGARERYEREGKILLNYLGIPNFWHGT